MLILTGILKEVVQPKEGEYQIQKVYIEEKGRRSFTLVKVPMGVEVKANKEGVVDFEVGVSAPYFATKGAKGVKPIMVSPQFFVREPKQV